MIVVDWARNYAESTTITSGRLSSMIWNGRGCRSSIAAGARQRSAAEGRTALAARASLRRCLLSSAPRPWSARIEVNEAD